MSQDRVRKTVQRMAPYTPGEQPQGTGITKLNTNENPYPPSPRVQTALADLTLDALRRYPDPTASPLRERIAFIHRCDPARVLVGNGSDEILSLCIRAFVENDGSVGYFNPSYSLYPVLADIGGVERRPVELGPEFEWRMPEDYSCSLFFLTNPNAPTGMLYDKATVRSFCRAFPGVVVLDEAYVEFAVGDCMDLALGMPNVLCVRTLSKSFSLAGLRVGYAVGPPDLVEALSKVKDSYNVNAVAQRLALAALSDLESMRRNVALVRHTRQRLAAALEAMGHRVFPSETNFLWVRPAGIAAADLFRRLRERRIFIRHFGAPRTRDFVRITVGTDPDVDVLLEAIKEIQHGNR